MITEMQEVTGIALADVQPPPEWGRLHHGVNETSAQSLETAEIELNGALRDASPGDLKSFLEQRLRRRSHHIYAESLAMMERYVLTRVLQQTRGNQSEASRLLGITRGCLRNRIRALHIVLTTNIVLESAGVNGSVTMPRQPT